MYWKYLLSNEKLVKHPDQDLSSVINGYFEKYPIDDLEIDYNNIISSSAFRRLQDKTQVFPLDKCDFIRTRLTHSIEVSTIARQLGIMVTRNNTGYEMQGLNKDDLENAPTEEQIASIPAILMCAGLLHDLGNPPFGHFGETIIGDWFKENLDKIEYKGTKLSELLDDQQAADLKNFEGNAQALRILLKATRGGDLNISKAIIATLVKYPNDSLHVDKDSTDIKRHKLGYYQAEETLYKDNIVKPLRLKDLSKQLTRHPLTYLLEAADDIAYATADLEDGFKKNLFTLDQFIAYFKEYDLDREKESLKTQNRFDGTNVKRAALIKKLEDLRKVHKQDSEALAQWMNEVRHTLMYCAAYQFLCSAKEKNNPGWQILMGNYEHDLFYDTFHEFTIEILKKFMVHYGFQTEGVLKLELSAQSILSFLLDKFIHAMLYYGCEDRDHKMTKEDKKYKMIFSQSLLQDYDRAKTEDENYNLYLRLLMVTDYISGMTDGYARDLYRELKGID